MSDVIDELKVEITAESKKADDKIDDLCDKIEKLASSLGSLNGKKATGLQDLQKATEGVSKVVTDLTSKYKDLGKGFTLKGDTARIQKEIDKLSNAFERANLKKEMLEASDNISGKMYEYAVRDAQMYGNQIESLKNQLNSIGEIKLSPELELKLANLEKAEKQVGEIVEEIPRTVEVPADSLGYNQQAIEFIEQYSKQAEKSVQSLEEKLSELTVPEVRTENLDKLNSSIEKAEVKLEELRTKLSNGIVMGTITDNVDDKGYVRLQEQIALTEKRLEVLQIKKIEVESTAGGNALGETSERLSEISKKGKNATNSLIVFAKSLGQTTNSSKKFNGSLAKGVKNLLAYGFGIRSVYVLFNKFRSGIKEGMKNLVQYSSETNASMSLLANSFTQTKNASAAMVAPLLNAVAPALNIIVQWCITGVNALNQLFSALAGKSTWIKAKTLTDDYAASLDKANSSAKKLYNTTLGIDELNINSGDTSSGTGYTGTSATDMFETVEVENKFKNLADKIREYLQPVIDFVEETKAKIKKIIEDIKIGDWFAVGEDTSDLVTDIFDFLSDALDDVDWKEIGKSIGEFLKGIKWKEVFESVGSFLEVAVDSAVSLFKGLWDANPLAAAIVTALGVAQFTGLGTVLNNAVNTALGATGLKVAATIAIIAIAWEVGFDYGKKLAAGFYAENDEEFQAIMNFKWTGEGGFFDTITNTDFSTHIDALKMMLEDSNGLIGVFHTLTEIVEIWVGKAKNAFTSVKNSIKDMFKTLIGVIKTNINLIIGYVNGMLSGIEKGINYVIGSVNKLSFDVPDWVPLIGGETFGFNIPTISIGKIPQLETGGFVPSSYSLFMAGENGIPEILGTVGGKPAVASGTEITGISNAVYSTSEEELRELREMNSLLRQLLEKDTSVNIGDREIYKASIRGSKSYGRLIVT